MPQIGFTKAFNLINSRLVSPGARELEWYNLYDHVVPVIAYLFSLHIMNYALCPFCRWPETLAHAT